uniref:ribonuclease H1 n=1 Tax=Myxine glutinosa TaxID=7769 RepID=UPI00358F1732
MERQRVELSANMDERRTNVIRMKESFYAVKKGREVGVFTSWTDCEKMVKCYQGAIFKKYSTEEEAWKFVERTDSKIGHQPEPSAARSSNPPREAGEDVWGADIDCNFEPSTSQDHTEGVKRTQLPNTYKHKATDDVHAGYSGNKRCRQDDCTLAQPASLSDRFQYMGDTPLVYTDGSCIENGKVGASAGIGVYWGPNHPLNLSEKLAGRQTNQRAEIIAACRALEQAMQSNFSKLVLYTDSKFTINGITKWIHKWKISQWKLSTGGLVINRQDFERLDELCQHIDVNWIHVPGHSNYPGNDAADKLAKAGSSKRL